MESDNENIDSGAIAKKWLWSVNIIAMLFIGGIIYSFVTPPTPVDPKSEQAASFDAEAKSDLKNFYKACVNYWALTNPDGSCDVKTASKPEYGYVWSSGIVIGGPLGSKSNFEAWGKYFSSTNAFSINANGDITEIEHKMVDGKIEKVESLTFE
jgi:hypothetical protein